MEIYKTAFETWRSQVDSYWQRSNYFAAFETAAITGGWLLASGPRLVEVGAGCLFSVLGFTLTLVWYKQDRKVSIYVRHWWDSIRECERKLNLTPYDFAQQLETRQGERNAEQKTLEYQRLIKWVPKLFAIAWIALVISAICRGVVLWCRYGHARL
jgi:hypothetical protein